MNKIKLILCVTAFFTSSAAIYAETQEEIDEFIQNHVILCTGPSLNRKEMLKDTTEHDLELIPFKKIFVVTNDPSNMDLNFDPCPSQFQLIADRGHQYDCINCIILSIKAALEDPETCDEDIIIFKHESVYINDMFLVERAIGKMLRGSNMVVRLWAPDHFYMTNVFYIRAGAARDVFDSLEFVETFPDDLFCETYFTKYIVERTPDAYIIPYEHLTRKDNELGFHHYSFTWEDPNRTFWDKSNYFDLYND